MSKLEGKTALVTGGNSGIGLGLTLIGHACIIQI
jgi:NAD(P)-dependent dehydrogenase (short-subunit alcohol dehydrogenase family)